MCVLRSGWAMVMIMTITDVTMATYDVVLYFVAAPVSPIL